jgi:hypothetical protein
MTNQDFVKSYIDDLVKQFPHAQCRYEHDQLSKAHFIEVLPFELYDSPQFMEWERNTISKFIVDFPYENICFLSSDAVVELTEIIYQKYPILGAEFQGEFTVEKLLSKLICNENTNLPFAA